MKYHIFQLTLAILGIVFPLPSPGGERPPSAPEIDSRFDGIEDRLSVLETRLDAVEGKSKSICPCPDGPCICDADSCDCADCPEHGAKSKLSDALICDICNEHRFEIVEILREDDSYTLSDAVSIFLKRNPTEYRGNAEKTAKKTRKRRSREVYYEYESQPTYQPVYQPTQYFQPPTYSGGQCVGGNCYGY